MKKVLISLLDTRSDTLIKVGDLLKSNNITPYYFSNEKITHMHQDPVLILGEQEYSVCDINLKAKFQKIFETDRSMRFYYSESVAIKIMQKWYDNAKEYILHRNIKHCLIEGTPAHELVVELVCIDLGVNIINICHAPGPRGWSLASKSSIEYPLYGNQNKNEEYIAQLSGHQNEIKVYLDSKHTWYGKVLRLIKRKRNYNYYPKWYIVLKVLKYPINIVLRFILKIWGNSQYNHVLYLHEEPERTVYNCGAVFNTQLSALKTISKDLNINISVKEHPNHKGNLPLGFYLSILLHPRLNYITTLSRTPELVWTFSGSIAWERSLKGLPVVSLGKTYLHKSNCVYGYPDIFNHIEKEDDLVDYISKHVFAGELTGTHWIPSEISDANIENLTKIIVTCINEVH